jgi:hypothetical protein
VRTLTNTAITTLASRAYLMAELIEIEFDTPLYLTTAGYDITTTTTTSGGSQTYIAQGDFLNFTGVNESDEVRVNSVNMTVQAASNKFTNVILNGNYLHRAFRIYKILLDADTITALTDPIMVYSGQITGASATDSPTQATVSIVTANEFYDFERTSGRKTNDNSQRRYYPGDRGMEYSTMTISDINWGKA